MDYNDNYLDATAEVISEMHVLVEGAIAIFENDTGPLNRLATQHKEYEARMALNDIGAELYTFRMAWECARPNAIVTVVALYDGPQMLPLPEMYGKNLIFKTGGVDGCNCAQTLKLIEDGKIDTTPLITHTYSLKDIEEAYRVFENRLDGVIKIAIRTA